MYNEEALSGSDPYAYFLYGNQPLVVIKTGAAAGGQRDSSSPRNLLLIKDSYAHELVPFLACHFDEIHMIDLRYFHSGVKAYIAENGIDMAVISYSIRSFGTDTNVFFLNAAG